jgi:Pyruvate/2-oxoacid:ferredoxin oxidoreductase delta subunit
VTDKNAEAASNFAGFAIPMVIFRPTYFFDSFHECFLALYFCLDPQIVDFEDSNFKWVTVTD